MNRDEANLARIKERLRQQGYKPVRGNDWLHREDCTGATIVWAKKDKAWSTRYWASRRALGLSVRA